MRRLARILLNTATVLSLLLCLSTVVLWIRSYHHVDAVTLGRGQLFSTWLGGLHYYGMRPGGLPKISPSSAPLPPNLRWDGAQYSASPRHQFHGFIIVPKGQIRFSGGMASLPPPSYTAVRIPIWVATIATFILPTIWRIRRLRRQRQVPGICPQCGYDLRATSNQCPECGAVPANPAT